MPKNPPQVPSCFNCQQMTRYRSYRPHKKATPVKIYHHCLTCPFKTKYLKVLKNHLRKHPSKPVLRCPKCDTLHTPFNNYQAHVRLCQVRGDGIPITTGVGTGNCTAADGGNDATAGEEILLRYRPLLPMRQLLILASNNTRLTMLVL